MKDKKLLLKFFLILFVLCLFVLISYSLLKYFYPVNTDNKAPLLVSIFSVAATLSAPITAFLFYNNWKAQTKFNRVTTNILELQKNLHDYVTELKFLRNRIIFPYFRNKFSEEEDYFNNLKKLLDQKVCEISKAERLKYESSKLLSILRNDTFGLSNTLLENINDLEKIINQIYMDIQEFKHNYFVFINHYYKDDYELKIFIKTDEYKELTYKISSTRETNNVIKTNLKLALSLKEESITPQTTYKIHRYIDEIDTLCTNLLNNYELNFKQ
jgi:hypothetical protein